MTELEQSRRDQEHLSLQLQEARKLESLGVLAGGIAHDFNNLLAVILSSVRYARSSDATPEDRADALGDAEEATESAARLVKQLLAYAGRRSPEVRTVELSELARSLSDLLSTALPGGVALELDLAREPLQVHADVVQLEQVLMNLVLNAADAVGEGPGTVIVRTSREQLEAEQLARWLGGENLAGGSYACLEVEDTGVGMDAETRAHIFEPFFSTKQDGHGLGLSAVLGLVQGHRGAIDVASEPGRGTRMRVFLPADATPVSPAAPRARAPIVLVAEPDSGLRGSAAETLRGAGHGGDRSHRRRAAAGALGDPRRRARRRGDRRRLLEPDGAAAGPGAARRSARAPAARAVRARRGAARRPTARRSPRSCAGRSPRTRCASAWRDCSPSATLADRASATGRFRASPGARSCRSGCRSTCEAFR